MIIVNSVTPPPPPKTPTFTHSPLFLSFAVKGGEAAGTRRLSKSKKWYCHTSRMAVWCLFKRGGKKKKKKAVQAIESYLLANTSSRSHLHHYSNMFYFQRRCSQWLTSLSHVLLSWASDPLNMRPKWSGDAAFSCTAESNAKGEFVGFFKIAAMKTTQISHTLLMLCLQQVNGTFRPSSTGSVWENLLQLCSLSLRTITTEKPGRKCRRCNAATVSLLCNH